MMLWKWLGENPSMLSQACVQREPKSVSVGAR